jgi:hypothetical protein
MAFPSARSTVASKDRSILVVGGVATPIEEALETIGLGGEQVTFLQDTDSPHFFNELPLQTIKVDWFIAVYTGANELDGKPDSKIIAWIHSVANMTRMLIQCCQLKAALVFTPVRFPNALTMFRKKAPHLPPRWVLRQLRLQNTCHGGRIETDQEVLMVGTDEVDGHFSLPSNTQNPQSMEIVLEAYSKE